MTLFNERNEEAVGFNRLVRFSMEQSYPNDVI